MRQYFYLHGFRSGPYSGKAVFLQERFAELGLDLCVPDLNQPDFSGLTLSRQLEQAKALFAPRRPVVLLGSSFGALTALWLAQQCPQVERLVLLAPALNFAANARRYIGEAMLQQWRDAGRIPVYHYHYDNEAQIDYGLMRDLENYPDQELQRELPGIVLHGRDDAVIPLADVRDFIAQRSYLTLHELDDEHGLGEQYPAVWNISRKFLSLK